MELIQRLLEEWSHQACGVTIDIVGDASLSSELQWAIAFPLGTTSEDACTQFLAALREDLQEMGLQQVHDRHFEHETQLPNGHAIETSCPYRPETCSGDHLLATGRGLISVSQFLQVRD